MRKILVMRGGALGDFVLTLPVLAALRGRFPGCSIEILGNTKFAALAIAGGLTEGVMAIESPALAGFFAAKEKLREEMVEYFRGFDLFVSYLYDPERIFQGNVGICNPARFIAGPHRPDEALHMHATEILLRPLEAVGIRDADRTPRLLIEGDSVNYNFIAMHPGSGSERKNWPEEAWGELLRLICVNTTIKVLLIGGEAEGERCQRLAAALPATRVAVAQDLPIVALAGRMKGCAGFVGHDSGISHLAAALGLPGLVLWGETSETTWRPMSDQFDLIRDARGLAHLPVLTVWNHLKKSPMAASAA
ncbi:MAG TPA: glycosyltransferase family 9 protein [Verrucomicrobiae bacterium]|jgi:ADP-heptose:LPS heptosyltransferase